MDIAVVVGDVDRWINPCSIYDNTWLARFIPASQAELFAVDKLSTAIDRWISRRKIGTAGG